MIGYSQMPFMYQGVIIDVYHVPEDEEQSTEGFDNFVSYNVKIVDENGNDVLLHDVPCACMFGGIGDFAHIRRRATTDGTPSSLFTTAEGKYDQFENSTSRVGDRVIVSFLGAQISNPVIIGFLPHPSNQFQLPENEPDSVKERPQARVQYMGNQLDISPIGEMTYTHFGAPAVSDLVNGETLEPEEIEDTPPAELAERSAEEGLPIPALTPILPQRLINFDIDEGDEEERPAPLENEALIYPDPKYMTQMGFLSKGEFYVQDSAGQALFFARDETTITVTNQYETIQLDKANKKIYMNSSGDFEVNSDADYNQSIKGNRNTTIAVDEIIHVQGNEFKTVDLDVIHTIKGNHETTISGDYTITSEGKFFNIFMKSGNSFVLDDDKKAMFLIHNTGATISVSPDGDVAIQSTDGSLVSLNTKKGDIGITTKAGGYINVGEKILMSDKSGKQILTLTDSTIEINADSDVILNAKNVNINSGSVALGSQAALSVAIAENLITWLDSHSHSVPTGISGPPLVPSAVFAQTPLDIASKYVKIKANI